MELDIVNDNYNIHLNNLNNEIESNIITGNYNIQ